MESLDSGLSLPPKVAVAHSHFETTCALGRSTPARGCSIGVQAVLNAEQPYTHLPEAVNEIISKREAVRMQGDNFIDVSAATCSRQARMAF